MHVPGVKTEKTAWPMPSPPKQQCLLLSIKPTVRGAVVQSLHFRPPLNSGIIDHFPEATKLDVFGWSRSWSSSRRNSERMPSIFVSNRREKSSEGHHGLVARGKRSRVPSMRSVVENTDFMNFQAFVNTHNLKRLRLESRKVVPSKNGRSEALCLSFHR